LARWNHWVWQNDDSTIPGFWYLTGLLFLAIFLALLRAIGVFVMRYPAAGAALSVATWLRRAIYHHTYRLGNLAIRPSGPGEAAELFGRHVESIHDAVEARLTSQSYGPIQVFLLLLFALLIHYWLAAALLLAGVIVVVLGGQIAAWHRHTGRIADRRATAQMALLRESLLMMRLVKSMVMEVFNQSRVERQLSEYATARRRRFV